MFHVLASLLLHRRLRDFTNNLKLLKQEVVANLELESSGFAVNAETGFKPLLMGYRVKAVPISWINRTPQMGKSTFSLWKYGMEYFRVLARLAWRSRFGFRRLPRFIDDAPVKFQGHARTISAGLSGSRSQG
jgi:hypothetical protein